MKVDFVAACLTGLFIVASLSGHNPPAFCEDCTCKMIYGWTVPNNKASGVYRVVNGRRVAVQNGMAIQSAECGNLPKWCPSNETATRFEADEFQRVCLDNPNSRLQIECVNLAGTWVQKDQIFLGVCVGENVDCPAVQNGIAP